MTLFKMYKFYIKHEMLNLAFVKRKKIFS